MMLLKWSIIFVCLVIGESISSSVEIEVVFHKTHLVEDIRPFPALYNVSVLSRLDCSQLCAKDHECRKYRYCQDDGTNKKSCDLYSDGTDCVHVNNGNQKCSCYRKWKQTNGTHCVSPIGYYGAFCDNVIIDCHEGQMMGMPATSLSYIQPINSIQPFEVLCNNGQTSIQVRTDSYAPVDFNRTWADYLAGFGNMHSEHWLGLNKIRQISDNPFAYSLSISLTDYSNNPCFVSYSGFRISSDNGYRFQYTLPPYVTPPVCQEVVDRLAIYMNETFSTYDNGLNSYCAAIKGGGWWFSHPFNVCTPVNVNGRRDLNGINWYSIVLNKVVMELGR